MQYIKEIVGGILAFIVFFALINVGLYAHYELSHRQQIEYVELLSDRLKIAEGGILDLQENMQNLSGTTRWRAEEEYQSRLQGYDELYADYISLSEKLPPRYDLLQVFF